MATTSKPNILVIWGDDIGITNLSCYSDGLMGYRTPNIDRLAKEGMRFTDSYGEQSCTAGRSPSSPGRASIAPVSRKSAFRPRRSGCRQRIQRSRSCSSHSATPRGSSARTISEASTSICPRRTGSTSSSAICTT
jgi:arylsulfatase A-like enzyme